MCGLGRDWRDAVRGTSVDYTQGSIRRAIPLAYVLAMPLGMRENGVFWSIVMAESLAGLVGIWWFRRGNWKRVQV